MNNSFTTLYCYILCMEYQVIHCHDKKKKVILGLGLDISLISNINTKTIEVVVTVDIY